MELNKFVQQTIEQIIEGVSNSQNYAKEKGAFVNPSNLNYHKDGKQNYYDHPIPQEITFDVGLTSSTSGGSTEGIGVFLGSISLGKKNESGTENSAITKVKFSVPVVLPSGGDVL